ncbi:MAG: PD-(D/E)XK nuclease family protein [Chloroflexi bacterium]|nr:PD-(D/E)XK nuclease family protein [Chloroflexota bacterium]
MLPADFQYSQSSLQDFADCARRFELRYIKQLHWPAVESQPIEEREEHAVRGQLLHRMIHQHQIGLTPDELTSTIRDDLVAEWWATYLASALTDLPARRYPEIALSAPLGDHRLVAKYDLLAIDPGVRAVIVDWKTSLRKPSRERLARRLQTIVYRYVLVLAGTALNGGVPLQPEQVEMRYWFAQFPEKPEIFTYASDQFRADGESLAALVADIQGRAADAFALTEDRRLCQFCTYRSLCDRGEKAGNFFDVDVEDEPNTSPELDFGLDLDQVAEIEF